MQLTLSNEVKDEFIVKKQKIKDILVKEQTIEFKDEARNGYLVTVSFDNKTNDKVMLTFVSGTGQYQTKYRLTSAVFYTGANHAVLDIDSVYELIDSLGGISKNKFSTKVNEFSEKGKFNTLNVLMRKEIKTKNETKHIISIEPFKHVHEVAFKENIKPVYNWTSSQVTRGFFHTFLWYIMFHFNKNFENVTEKETKTFIKSIIDDVNNGLLKNSYAQQLYRLSSFFKNETRRNKKGDIIQPKADIKNPFINESENDELYAFIKEHEPKPRQRNKKVFKRVKRQELNPFVEEKRIVEDLNYYFTYRIAKTKEEYDNEIAERKLGRLKAVQIAERNLAIFYLVRKFAMTPKEIASLTLKNLNVKKNTLKLGLTTIQLDEETTKQIDNYLTTIDRKEKHFNHDNKHIFVQRSRIPTKKDLEAIKEGTLEKDKFTYKKAETTLISYTFKNALSRKRNPDNTLVEKEEGYKFGEKITTNAKKVRNFAIREYLNEQHIDDSDAINQLRTSLYSVKYHKNKRSLS